MRIMLATSRHWFSAPGASVAGLSLLLVCGCSNFRANSAAASLPSAVPAHLYTVTEETTRRRVQAVGSLYPLEESTLSAQVEGRVSEVLADVGDRVEEGQALILLDEEHHIDWLEGQLHAIKEMTYENYLAQQLGEGEEK